MIVIKLGGSLLAAGWLGKCLDKIERDYAHRPVVIVPGGGVFAEQVRLLQQQWRFDDRTAHQMAILAMQQTALLIKGLKPAFLVENNLLHRQPGLSQTTPVIWSPDIAELDAGAVPANWQVTSDSLSAWLAKSIKASKLIVVKMAAIDANMSERKLAEHNIVDALFSSYAQAGGFSTTIINVTDFIDGYSPNVSQ